MAHRRPARPKRPTDSCRWPIPSMLRCGASNLPFVATGKNKRVANSQFADNVSIRCACARQGAVLRGIPACRVQPQGAALLYGAVPANPRRGARSSAAGRYLDPDLLRPVHPVSQHLFRVGPCSTHPVHDPDEIRQVSADFGRSSVGFCGQTSRRVELEP